MIVNIETFIPGLLKAVQRNGGILDIWEAKRIFGESVVKLAIKKEAVGKRIILLNAKTQSSTQIPCITLDWDGNKPVWLERYKTENVNV